MTEDDLRAHLVDIARLRELYRVRYLISGEPHLSLEPVFGLFEARSYKFPDNLAQSKALADAARSAVAEEIAEIETKLKAAAIDPPKVGDAGL